MAASLEKCIVYAVSRTSVEKDQYGSWNYYVPANGVFDELPVDRELHRESGLRKLTLKERKALGV